MPSKKRNSKHANHDRTKPYKVPASKKKTTSGSSKNQRTDAKTKMMPAVKQPADQKRKGNNKKKHPKLVMAFKIFIIAFLLFCVVGAGVIAAVFFGLFGDDFEISKEDLAVGVSNSIVVDKDGNEIANLSRDEKRKTIKLDDMADYLPKAYIAIEDKRFYDHNGVDMRRTGGAIVSTVFKGSSSYGGSTITQQLVKNITQDKESSGIAGIFRKVKEWAKAYQVERMISKEQIIELYLNILFVGGDNIHGVELGSQYYFSKSAKDLTLEECAFLAGINNGPASYHAFSDEEKDKEKIKNKTLTVLSEMKEQGYITDEGDYTAATEKVKEGLTFTKGTVSTASNYSYHTDAAIKQVVEQVMEEKNISREFAEKYVYSSGLTIYSTQDSSVQARVEEEFAKTRYQVKGKTKDKDGNYLNDHTQAGMVILDYKTGAVVAVGGSLGEKYASGWNRGTQMVRQTGSAMKPIADIAPGLQEKVITPSTVYDDVKTDFNGYTPKNDGNRYRGLINIRQFIATSQNIPAIKIMRELTPKKSIEYMKKMGITSLHTASDNPKQNDEVLSLAIGGVTQGVSPLEMASAYGTIANDGVHITPIFFTKVIDGSGNTVLTPKQETNKAISEQNAYLTRSITKEPVISGDGTATYCAIPGKETAAKTGTTDNNFDRWLSGMTPYYSAAVWFGYDTNEEVKFSGNNPAGQIWSNVMKDIHKNLAGASFKKPSGLAEATVCRKTGGLATSSCTDTYSETFATDNMPTKCQGHGVQKICNETQKLATEYCPDTKSVSYGGTVPKESLGLWKPIGAATSTSGDKVSEVCNVHTKPEEKEKPKDNTANTINNTNTANTGNNTMNNTNTANNTGNNTGGGNKVPGGNTVPGNNTTPGGNSAGGDPGNSGT